MVDDTFQIHSVSLSRLRLAVVDQTYGVTIPSTLTTWSLQRPQPPNDNDALLLSLNASFVINTGHHHLRVMVKAKEPGTVDLSFVRFIRHLSSSGRLCSPERYTPALQLFCVETSFTKGRLQSSAARRYHRLAIIMSASSSQSGSSDGAAPQQDYQRKSLKSERLLLLMMMMMMMSGEKV
jgi:hypothetical protein